MNFKVQIIYHFPVAGILLVVSIGVALGVFFGGILLTAVVLYMKRSVTCASFSSKMDNKLHPAWKNGVRWWMEVIVMLDLVEIQKMIFFSSEVPNGTAHVDMVNYKATFLVLSPTENRGILFRATQLLKNPCRIPCEESSTIRAIWIRTWSTPPGTATLNTTFRIRIPILRPWRPTPGIQDLRTDRPPRGHRTLIGTSQPHQASGNTSTKVLSLHDLDFGSGWKNLCDVFCFVLMHVDGVFVVSKRKQKDTCWHNVWVHGRKKNWIMSLKLANLCCQKTKELQAKYISKQRRAAITRPQKTPESYLQRILPILDLWKRARERERERNGWMQGYQFCHAKFVFVRKCEFLVYINFEIN